MSHNSSYTFTRVLSNVVPYLLAGCLSLPVIALAQGESNSSITLYPNNTTIDPGLNTNVVSQTDEIVTVGIPFADCTLYDANNFRLFDDTDTEVQVYVEVLAEWPATRQPCGAASIRALQVQFEFDATSGAPVVYEWDLQGPRSNADYGSAFDINAYEVVHDNPIKGGLMEPRVFAINDPAYLVQTGLMPPTAPYTAGDYDDNYYPKLWSYYARDFDFTTSTAGNWLFDRVSSLYRQAMRRGEVLHYREAYVAHEFYISKIEVTGANTGAADYCVGGFDYATVADSYGSGGKGCDSKYLYSQNIRLHLSLTGDDSWQPSDNGPVSASGIIDTREEAWNTMADLLFVGSTRCPTNSACQGPAVPPAGFSEAYDEVGDGYTERKAGFGLQTVLSSCQLTLDPTVCGWADTIVNNMYDHQTNNPDGLGNRGYLAHSWHRHEGSFVPWIGELAADYTNATSIVINKSVADSPDSLSSGNMIRVYTSSVTDINLTADPTENPDGTWNLQLETPITGSSGDRVNSSFIADTNQTSAGALLDIPSDRVFSPWMQAIIADAIWEYYFWTESETQKAKAEALLLGFAQAIAAYGIDGNRIGASTKTLVENAFGVTIFNSQFSAYVGCGLTVSPHSRYVAADYMGSSDMTRELSTYMFSGGGFADQHTPEALFQLSLGIFFETDPAKKAAMQALAADAQNWFERSDCTAGTGYPPRAITWQNKIDPFGTYKYVSEFSPTDDDDTNTSDDDTNSENFALSFNSDTFFESNSNSGESTTILTATLSGGESFVVDSGPMSGSHYSTANVPSNMTVKVTGASSTTATVELTGNATSHSADVTNLTVTFLDAAFNGSNAAFVEGSSKNDLIIDFNDAIITYGNNSFIEADANDGSTNTILNLDLTFVSFVNAVFESPTHYSISNIPDGLTAQVNRTGPDSVTFALTGAAVNHEDGNDVSNIQLAFTNAAFTNGDASTVVNAIKSNIIVDFANNPVEDGEGTETPIGGVGGTETPTEGGEETETPIGGVGGTETEPDYENIQVDPGTELVNDGTLTDVNNQGTIIGGLLNGEVNNQGGILVDVTLLPGTQISGGTVLGHLMGSGSVSNILLDLESIGSEISVGFGTQVTNSTVSNVPGLDLTAAILEESGVPDIDFPFLIDSEIGDFSLAGLIELALNVYFRNSSTDISVNADGKVVLTNEDLKKNSVIPVELSRVVTTNRPDGVTLTKSGTLEIAYHGISTEFAPTPLVRIFPRASQLKGAKQRVSRRGTAQLLSVEGSTITSDATLLEDGLVSIQLGDITLLQRFGWMATMSDTTPLSLNEEGETTFELIGSSSDPVSQQVIVHYPDNSTQALIPFLDSLTEFGSIVSQSEYEASISIDPLTGIMQFFDPDMNLIFTAIPDVVSLPAEHGITGAVLDSVGDRNGDGYPDFYFKTPVRTQLIYGLSP